MLIGKIVEIGVPRHGSWNSRQAGDEPTWWQSLMPAESGAIQRGCWWCCWWALQLSLGCIKMVHVSCLPTPIFRGFFFFGFVDLKHRNFSLENYSFFLFSSCSSSGADSSCDLGLVTWPKAGQSENHTPLAIVINSGMCLHTSERKSQEFLLDWLGERCPILLRTKGR